MSALPPDDAQPSQNDPLDPFKGAILGGSWESLHEQARRAFVDGELALAAAFEEEASLAPEATDAQIASSLMHRARCLDELDRHAEEVGEYDQVIARFLESQDPEAQSWVAQALINRGITFSQQGLAAKALADFDTVVNRWRDAKHEDLAYEVARAFHFQGLSLAAIERHEEAAQAFQEALARLPESPEEAEFIARIQFNLGRSLIALGRSEEAIEGLGSMALRHLDALDPDRRNLAARAIMAKAFLLFELKRHEEEIALYDLMVERFDADPNMQEFIARALFERAIALGSLGRREDEVAQYAALAQRFEDSEVPALRLFAAKALVNRGCTLHALGFQDEALIVLRAMVERFQEDPLMLDQIARALGEQASALDSLGRHEEEIQVYDALIARLQDPLEPSMARRAAFAYTDKALTLRSLNRIPEAIQTLNDVLARFGEDRRSPLAEPLATALREKADLLDHEGWHEEELAIYDRLLAMYERTGEGNGPRAAQALWAQAITLRQLERLDEAEAALGRIAERFASATYITARSKAPAALLEMGILLRNQDRLEEAEATHRRGLFFLEDAEPEVRREAARCAVNLASLLRGMGRETEAMELAENFLQRSDAFTDLLEPAIRMSAVKVGLLADLERTEESRELQRAIVDRFHQHPDPEVRTQIVESLFNLAIAFGEADQPQVEQAIYEELLEKFGTDAELLPEAYEWIASAMLNRACVLHKLDHALEALEGLDQLMERFGEDPERDDEISRALRERASILETLARPEEELQAYDELIRRYVHTKRPDLLRRTVRSLLDRGITLGELGRPEEELASYDRLAAICELDPEGKLQSFLARSLANSAEVLSDLGRDTQAMAALDRLLALPSEDAQIIEAQGQGLRQKAEILESMGETQEAIALHEEVFQRFQTSEDPEHRAWAAEALFEQALSHADENPQAEAAAYTRIIQTFGGPENLEMEEVQEWVAKALLNQALDQEIAGEPEAALETYRQVMERYPSAEWDELRAQVAKAHGLMGTLLEEQGRRQEARDLFQKALETFRNDDDDDVLSELALSLRGRIRLDILAAKADILRATQDMQGRLRLLAKELDDATTLREDDDDIVRWSLERAYLLHLAGEDVAELIQEALEDWENEDPPQGVWLDGPALPADRTFKQLLDEAWEERE